MPLSKAKQAEWMREYRKRQGVIPKAISGLVMSGNRILGITDSLVIPKKPSVDADGELIPDYS